MTWAGREEDAPLLVVDAVGRAVERLLIPVLPEAPLAVAHSRDPWQLAADVRAAAEDGCRFFVCCGGDGAFLAAVAGTTGVDGVLLGFGGGPASLPRTYGLPADPEQAARHLTGDSDAPLDAVAVRPEIGHAVEVANAVWWGFGRFAGFLAGAAGRWPTALRIACLSPRRESLLLETEETRREVAASGLLVANGEFLGPLDVVPRAHPGDGQLDVLVFRGPARDVWRMLPRMRTGTHLPHPRVAQLRPRRIRIDGEGRLWAEGVDVARLPAVIEAVTGRLRMAL